MPKILRKRPTNLSLAPARLAFAHGYAKTHATSLSELVESLLGALEQVVRGSVADDEPDLLDGILLGTPLADTDKHALRKAHHEARLSK